MTDDTCDCGGRHPADVCPALIAQAPPAPEPEPKPRPRAFALLTDGEVAALTGVPGVPDDEDR